MKLKYQIEILDIDGSPVAVPVDCGDDFRGVLHMNDTTKDILEILKNDVTEDEIVVTLQQEYDAAEEDIRRNVQKVLEILLKYQLIS